MRSTIEFALWREKEMACREAERALNAAILSDELDPHLIRSASERVKQLRLEAKSQFERFAKASQARSLELRWDQLEGVDTPIQATRPPR
jgi:hypothetical protein